jgi:fused signal recognition particle receptor
MFRFKDNLNEKKMLKILKRKKKTAESTGMFGRLKTGLAKTRRAIGESVANALLGQKELNQEALLELETCLLTADVGVETTQMLVADLTKHLARKQLNDVSAVFKVLQQDMLDILVKVEQPLVITSQHRPFVILMVGVNGSGKTTTIGKLASQFKHDGKKVMLAAGDTFRAAAIEQLQVWGERNQVPVIAQQTGADSASVIFDAYNAAKSRNMDVLIADTAGRLHTQSNLMEELKKIKRVLQKIDLEAPHEVMLVLDAGIGQNALTQAKQFQQAVDVTGIVLTKLDGTAKGGIIFAIARELGLPIRFIGVGEGVSDLRPFAAKPFVEALFT